MFISRLTGEIKVYVMSESSSNTFEFYSLWKCDCFIGWKTANLSLYKRYYYTWPISFIVRVTQSQFTYVYDKVFTVQLTASKLLETFVLIGDVAYLVSHIYFSAR